MSISGINLKLKTVNFGGENNIFDSQQMRWVRGGVTIDSTKIRAVDIAGDGVLRKIVAIGTPLAKIAASGKYCPAKNTTVAAEAADDAVAVELADVSMMVVGDTLSFKGGAAKTISAIDYATKIVTLSAATGAALAVGDAAKGTVAGDAVLLLGETVEVTEGDVGTTALDMARVIEARLPVVITADMKTTLKFISFA